MPSVSVPNKVAATRGYGATVYHSGSTAPEREAVAAEVMAKTGARMVPPYDHGDIILGQGMFYFFCVWFMWCLWCLGSSIVTTGRAKVG